MTIYINEFSKPYLIEGKDGSLYYFNSDGSKKYIERRLPLIQMYDFHKSEKGFQVILDKDKLKDIKFIYIEKDNTVYKYEVLLEDVSKTIKKDIYAISIEIPENAFFLNRIGVAGENSLTSSVYVKERYPDEFKEVSGLGIAPPSILIPLPNAYNGFELPSKGIHALCIEFGTPRKEDEEIITSIEYQSNETITNDLCIIIKNSISDKQHFKGYCPQGFYPFKNVDGSNYIQIPSSKQSSQIIEMDDNNTFEGDVVGFIAFANSPRRISIDTTQDKRPVPFETNDDEVIISKSSSVQVFNGSEYIQNYGWLRDALLGKGEITVIKKKEIPPFKGYILKKIGDD